MTRPFPLFVLLSLAVSGCAVVDRISGQDRSLSDLAPPVAPVVAAPVQPLARTAAALDTTTAAEREAALAAPAPAGERSLGKVVVSLGSPAEPGIWLRTTLVSQAGTGRVVLANGTSVAVDLLPGASGAQLSLAAYRALGIGLTDLPEVMVYVN